MSTQIQITPETGITIGTTPITSGTNTRVFFQEGGVVQQDANFTYNNTQKRLTLRAGGATASDIPFVVRNSTDTYDIISSYGNELTVIGRNESTEPRLIINRAGSTKMVLGGTTDLNIQFPSSGYGVLNSGAQGWDIVSSSGDIKTRNSSTYTLLKGNFFGIGQATPAARLDVQAQGALSTDIAFRVRNSANTRTNFEVNGLGQVRTRTNSFHGDLAFISYVSDSATERDAFRFSHYVQNFMGRTWTFDAGTNGNIEGFQLRNDLSGNDQGLFTIQANNYCFGTTISVAEGVITERRVMRLVNGVAPSTSVTDGFKLYSADITAGNAAPHFRTENGGIIKLYQETTGVAAATLVGGGGTTITDTDTFDGYTLKQIVKALRNQGILA